MQTIEIHLHSLGLTEKLGRLLGNLAAPGDVICLEGDLGAGKTALAQAIARGLEVPDDCYVTSPSFALVHEYLGRLPMYHMDFYRLQDGAEAEDLGFAEYFFLSGLSVIEWSSRAQEILPEERLILHLVLNEDLSRTATVQASDKYTDLLRIISGEMHDNTSDGQFLPC